MWCDNRFYLQPLQGNSIWAIARLHPIATCAAIR